MSGAEKAAILLLTVGDEIAAEIMKELGPKEIRRIAGTATRLPIVSQAAIDRVHAEFMSKMSAGVSIGGRRSREKIHGILSKFLTEEQVDRHLDVATIGQDASDGFETLKSIDSETLATVISNEHPQTIALVLAHLDAAKAASVVAELPREMRSDALLRVANIGRVSPQIVKDIQEVLVQDIVASGSGGGRGRTVGGPETVAELMNQLDGRTRQAIFDDLEEAHGGFVEEIRDLMFAFNDLMEIDDRDLQSIVKEVTSDVLTLALKMAPEELCEKIYKNVSSRAAEMIAEELQAMGPVKVGDVESAQREIVAIARRLEEEGRIALSGGGAEALV